MRSSAGLSDFTYRNLAIVALVLGGCTGALASCEGASVVADIPLSAERFALRKGAYEELCNKRGGDLVDGANVNLAGRLSAPDKAKWPPPGNSGDGDAKKKTGPTVMDYIVEKSGEVTWLSILQSSGSKSLDEMAARLYARARFRKPAQLDGEPVPVFVTVKVDLVRRDYAM